MRIAESNQKGFHTTQGEKKRGGSNPKTARSSAKNCPSSLSPFDKRTQWEGRRGEIRTSLEKENEKEKATLKRRKKK